MERKKHKPPAELSYGEEGAICAVCGTSERVYTKEREGRSIQLCMPCESWLRLLLCGLPLN